MKKRLFIYSTVVLMFALITAAMLWYSAASRLYTRDTIEALVTIGNTIKHSYKSAGYDTMAKDYGASLKHGIRITFINQNGTVLGDSLVDYIGMENHAGRKEIIDAKNGEIGSDVRKSTSTGHNYIYVAMSFKDDVFIRIAKEHNGITELLNYITAGSIWGIILIIIISAILSFIMSRLLVAPLNRLAADMELVSSGDYTVRASTDTIEELKPLAREFNNMTSALVYNIKTLREQKDWIKNIISNMHEGFVTLDKTKRIDLINQSAIKYLNYNGEDPTGLNILTVVRGNNIIHCIDDALKDNVSSFVDIEAYGSDIRIFISPIRNGGAVLILQDITQLNKAERIRSEFAANVSHELKTPLTSIKGFVETLKEGAIDNKEVSVRFLDIIAIEAERLTLLINDILQLSEIETMKTDTNITACNLKEILINTIDIILPTAIRSMVNIEYECDNIQVFANSDRLKQLLINLIENAVKYNKENGSVKISVSKNKEDVTIAVSDSGIGISEEDLPRIFERFYRADKSRSKKVGGTGLGLSIVKHIVNLYSGKLNITSEVGNGTTISVVLPIGKLI